MNTQSKLYSPITQGYTRSQFIEAKQLRRNMTPAERRLWHALRGERLNGLHFRRQQAIRGFIVDFYCHRLRLIIEIDGPVHDQNQEHDAERSAAIVQTGMTILRFRNADVLQNIGIVLRQITQAAHQIDKEANLCN